jgi:alpha-beta hydrolase superfamily lysophospholipase
MKHSERSWTAADGQEIYSQVWEPEDHPRAAVCLVHGLGEHSSRYSHVAEHLTSAGFALLAFDLPGHGKSGGIRGHTTSNETFLENIDLLIDDSKRRYPETPRFLYGHSLGGIIVLFYTLKRQPELAGVIATSPGLRTSLEEQKLKIAAAKALGTFLPMACLSTGLKPEDISRDPDVILAYVNDPLVHDQSSFAMAKTSLEMIPWTFDHAHEFTLPLLLMHGTADRIAYARGSEEFAGLTSCNCTVKLWEGAYHETHNEPEKEDVLNFMVAWIERQITPAPGQTP